MRLGIDGLRRGAFALVFGAALVAGAGATANAQGGRHQEKDALKGHQRQERAYAGNSHATRDHQRAERDRLRYEQRLEHNGYPVAHGQYNNGGNYGNTPYNNGQAHTSSGYYGNNGGYYGSGPYYGAGRPNGGYYGNGRYYGNNRYSRPHRDSRNPVRRGVHHALGGH